MMAVLGVFALLNMHQLSWVGACAPQEPSPLPLVGHPPQLPPALEYDMLAADEVVRVVPLGSFFNLSVLRLHTNVLTTEEFLPLANIHWPTRRL